MPKHSVTRKNKPVGKKNTTNKKQAKHGGANYKSVELFYKDKPVLCDICGSNNYYQRDSTLGRSKASNLLYGSVYGSVIGSLSTFALFCNECGLARILKKENIFDRNNKKFKIKTIKNGKSIENNMGFLHRPLKI